MCVFYPFANNPKSKEWVKTHEKLVFGILLPLVIYLTGFILFFKSYFFWVDGQFVRFLPITFLKEAHKEVASFVSYLTQSYFQGIPPCNWFCK